MLAVTGVSVNLGVLGLCVEAVNLGYQVVVATDTVVGVPIDYGETWLLQTSVSLVRITCCAPSTKIVEPA